MYLLYIDDSGTCELKKDEAHSIDGGNSRYFVLGAVLIKANELNKINSDITSIKNKCLSSEYAEIKHSIKKINCINSCEKTPDKNCFKQKIASLISRTDCTVFACVQDKYSNFKDGLILSKSDVYRLSFEHLLKSVDTFMANRKTDGNIISFIDKKDMGDSKDKLVYESYQQALSNKKIFQSFDTRIFAPTINVVYSQYTIGVQLADFVAGSVFNFYESSEDLERQAKCKEITLQYSNRVYREGDKLLGLRMCNKKVY